jgi:ribosomal protein S18 acetylase RimI-like enzyme
LEHIITAPSHLKEGFATQMLAEIIGFAKKRKKVHSLVLDVRKNNDEAIRLYKKLGFIEQQSYSDIINGERVECIRMSLDLGK